jgi:hypothetical protein
MIRKTLWISISLILALFLIAVAGQLDFNGDESFELEDFQYSESNHTREESFDTRQGSYEILDEGDKLYGDKKNYTAVGELERDRIENGLEEEKDFEQIARYDGDSVEDDDTEEKNLGQIGQSQDAYKEGIFNESYYEQKIKEEKNMYNNTKEQFEKRLTLIIDDEEKERLEAKLNKTRDIHRDVSEKKNELLQQFDEKKVEVKKAELDKIKVEVRQKVFGEISERSKKDYKENIPIIIEKNEFLKGAKITGNLSLDTRLERKEVEARLQTINTEILKNKKLTKVLKDLEGANLSVEKIEREIELTEREIEEDFELITKEAEDVTRKHDLAAENLVVEKNIDFYEKADEISNNPESLSIINVRIKPLKTLFNVTIFEEIPKDIASNIADVVFYNKNHEVINPDPLIMWQFGILNEEVELSYGVRKKVETAFIEDGKTLIIAEKISEEKGLEGKYSLASIIFSVVMTAFIAIMVIFFQRSRNK